MSLSRGRGTSRRADRPGPRGKAAPAPGSPAPSLASQPHAGPLLEPLALLDLQRTAGNRAVNRLLERGSSRVQRAIVQRAFWEKTPGGEYAWHGGTDLPDDTYVDTGEPKKKARNGKLYSVYAKKVAVKPEAPKAKGVVQQPVVQPPVVEPPPAKKLSATAARKLARGAPALLLECENQAILASTEMTNAGTAERAEASAGLAKVAASESAKKAAALTALAHEVSSHPESQQLVQVHEAAALRAAATAKKFADQADRLAAIVIAGRQAKVAADAYAEAEAQLVQARERETALTAELEYLHGYLQAFVTDMALVTSGSRGFRPAEDLGTKQREIEQGIQDAQDELRETVAAIKDLETNLPKLAQAKKGAAEDVEVKKGEATVGGTGLPEERAGIELLQELRTLAGGQVNLDLLLKLPAFTATPAALKPFLEAVAAAGVSPAELVRLITDLHASRAAEDLGAFAGAVKGGAAIDIVVALASVMPKVDAKWVVLFANVAKDAGCDVEVAKALLPLAAVEAYAKQDVLKSIALLALTAKPEAKPMVDLVVAKPALKPADLLELAKIFEHYPEKAARETLAAALIEGLAAGRTAANMVTIVSDLKTAGVALPLAETLKAVLKGLATYTVDDLKVLLTKLAGLTGKQLTDIDGWLNPLAVAAKLSLITAFVDDGTTPANVLATLTSMNRAGMNGTVIEQKVKFLRGFVTAPGGDQDAEITTPGGSKILSGPQIHQQVTSKLVGQNPSTKVGTLGKYPTGEDPSTRSEDTLWNDVDESVLLVGENADQAKIRQKLALAELMYLNGVDKDIVQQVFAVNKGKSPRAVDDPATEDARDPSGEAHVASMHTIGGGGNINTWADLTRRACFSPTARGRASAFKNAANAKTAIQAALTAYVTSPAQWRYLRGRLIRGAPVAFDEAVGQANGVILETNGGGGVNGLYAVNGDGTYLHQQALPPHAGGRGGRPLFPGDNTAIPNKDGFCRYQGGNGYWYFSKYGGATDADRVPHEPGNPLTVVAAVATTHLRLIGKNVTGGFVINSAYSQS